MAARTEMVPDQSDRSPGTAALRRRALPAVLLVLVGAVFVAGFWNWKGACGLAGSLAGLGLGAAAAASGHFLRRRALTETGPKMVQAMMASICASFGIFIGAAVVLSLLWKEGAAPALLTALGAYLAWTLAEAVSASAGGSRARGAGK